jgi:hypothetical protein
MKNKYNAFKSNSYPCTCSQFIPTKCDDCGNVITAWEKFVIVGLTLDKDDGIEYIRCEKCNACKK